MPQRLGECQARESSASNPREAEETAESRSAELRTRQKQTPCDKLVFFSDFLLIGNDHSDQFIRLQILLGNAQHVGAADLANQIAITVGIVQPELEKFHLRQKGRHLPVGVKTQRKAADQIILRVV